MKHYVHVVQRNKLDPSLESVGAQIHQLQYHPERSLDKIKLKLSFRAITTEYC